MQFIRHFAANTSLVSVLGLVFTLNFSRSAAILFFSWTALQSSEHLLPFASMLLIGELISMALSAPAGTWIAKHGAARAFLLGETLFVMAIGWYWLVSLSSAQPAFIHAVFSYALMSLASVIAYPASQTLLKIVSAKNSGTRNASLSNISSTCAYVLGPVFVGGLLAWQGALWALLACLCCAAVSIGMVVFFKPVKTSVAAATSAAATRAMDDRAASQPTPLIAMIAIIYSAFSFLATYLAPLAILQLQADASGLGLLRSAWSVGAVVGTIAIAVSASRKEPASAFLIAAALLWALGLSCIAFSASIPTAVAALLAAGLLFALTRSSFDGLLLRTCTPSDYPKRKARAQAGASALSVVWILLAVFLPPHRISYAFLLFASLVGVGALLFARSSWRAAKPLPKA